jgi:hypothetical protein
MKPEIFRQEFEEQYKGKVAVYANLEYSQAYAKWLEESLSEVMAENMRNKVCQNCGCTI